MRTPGAVSRWMRARSSPNAQRIKKFGRFFTGYMGTASLVTAALPVPVAKLHLIPAYASQSKFLNTYASLMCFLVFAYIFYSRHLLARAMFHRTERQIAARAWITLLPFVLICCSIACVITYHIELDSSLALIAAHGVYQPTEVLLEKIDYREIPLAETLVALYLGMFVLAESALVLMAMREYLQEILGLEEQQLIAGIDAGDPHIAVSEAAGLQGRSVRLRKG